MKGYCRYIIFSNPTRPSPKLHNVNLTLVGSENHASLTRENEQEDPEELLEMESVRVDILSNFTLDLEGFVRDQDGSTYEIVMI